MTRKKRDKIPKIKINTTNDSIALQNGKHLEKKY